MTKLADDIDLYGCMAQFATPEELVEAARRSREAGYERIEAYSPFPVHGINEALGHKPSVIPKLACWAAPAAAMTALAAGILLRAICTIRSTSAGGR